jgi:hypothetical protein
VSTFRLTAIGRFPARPLSFSSGIPSTVSYDLAMSRVLPFRRRSKHQYVSLTLATLTAAVIGFVTTWALTGWQSRGVDADLNSSVQMTDRSAPSGPIELIDGDTVRFDGGVYRLVGFDTPERGDRSR